MQSRLSVPRHLHCFFSHVTIPSQVERKVNNSPITTTKQTAGREGESDAHVQLSKCQCSNKSWVCDLPQVCWNCLKRSGKTLGKESSAAMNWNSWLCHDPLEWGFIPPWGFYLATNFKHWILFKANKETIQTIEKPNCWSAASASIILQSLLINLRNTMRWQYNNTYQCNESHLLTS